MPLACGPDAPEASGSAWGAAKPELRWPPFSQWPEGTTYQQLQKSNCVDNGNEAAVLCAWPVIGFFGSGMMHAQAHHLWCLLIVADARSVEGRLARSFLALTTGAHCIVFALLRQSCLAEHCRTTSEAPALTCEPPSFPGLLARPSILGWRPACLRHPGTADAGSSSNATCAASEAHQARSSPAPRRVRVSRFRSQGLSDS